jgi:hypothetical protein
MQKVKNVTKRLISIIFILSICSCASQKIDKNYNEEFAYRLINYHYANYDKKRNIINIFDKTINQESAIYLKQRLGISNYLKTFNKSFARAKCEMDSLIPKEIQLKLDSAYKKLKIIELDQKKIKLKKIKLISSDIIPEWRKVVSSITFPIIIKEKNVLYAIITDSDKFAGMIYLYKYEKGKWHLLCEKMLYIT